MITDLPATAQQGRWRMCCGKAKFPRCRLAQRSTLPVSMLLAAVAGKCQYPGLARQGSSRCADWHAPLDLHTVPCRNT